MKKILKSAGLPIGVFALAIGSAFATNAIKSTLSVVPGYQKMDTNGFVCTDPAVLCDTAPGEVCTWTDASDIEHTLYGKEVDLELNRTVCTLPLSRIE